MRRHPAGYEEQELELDLPPDDARRLGRARHDIAAEERALAPRRQGPTERDWDDARRIAAWGEPGGLFGSVNYAFAFFPRRRTLRRELLETVKKRDAAIAAAEASYVELGRRLHDKASEAGMESLRKQLAAVDHAALRNEQVQHQKRRKQELEIVRKRVEDAHRRLAEAALDQGLTDIDRQGSQRVITSVREANRLTREAMLRDLGLEMADESAVRRGLWTVAIAIALVAGALAYAAYA